MRTRSMPRIKAALLVVSKRGIDLRDYLCRSQRKRPDISGYGALFEFISVT